MPKIIPSLWFDDNGLEAAEFYCSIFPNSSVTSVTHYGSATPGMEGKVLTVEWELDGQPFLAINGGPQFTFDEAVSLEIECKDQAEIDYYWDALLAGGGEESQCGWLKDKFGFSWQVVNEDWADMIKDPNDPKGQAAVQAMYGMKKLDIAALQRAYDEA